MTKKKIIVFLCKPRFSGFVNFVQNAYTLIYFLFVMLIGVICSEDIASFSLTVCLKCTHNLEFELTCNV